jgi:hypothetical protein
MYGFLRLNRFAAKVAKQNLRFQPKKEWKRLERQKTELTELDLHPFAPVRAG